MSEIRFRNRPQEDWEIGAKAQGAVGQEGFGWKAGVSTALSGKVVYESSELTRHPWHRA